MKVDLEVSAGPHAGTVYHFDRHDTFVVGRSSQAQFSVPDDGFLSRNHFLIEFNPPACLLRDLGSTNGTKVNGLRVETVRLRNGDEIVAGGSSFVIHVEESSEEALRVHCLGCGASAPLELMLAGEPGDMPASWLCEACKENRRKYPRTHADYLIDRKIGGGGMGEVYLARHLATNRPVAIKMMTPAVAASQRAKLRFERELDVLKHLKHPKIVEFYDVFDLAGQYQLVMEYVDGKNALAWVGALAEPLTLTAAASLGVQLLSALDHAHQKGYVHRDIKPSNLLVQGQAHHPKMKLSDFGLAKSFRDNAGFAGLTHQGDIGGSSGFISPDHIRDFREAKEPADLYSAGATLYYLMSGQYPFFGFDPNRADSYTMILEHPPVPLRAHRPDVPDTFDRVIRKALEKQPAARWKTAAEMAAALVPFVGGA
ncbi:MAG TPA: FHA domain-containing serine/threonine-protein kinase [Isosphaeraceae bacterium]